jgi:hypothetical protein
MAEHDRKTDQRRPQDRGGASARAHGTHGKRDTPETPQSDTPTEAGSGVTGAENVQPTEGESSDAGWGRAASGGSVVDKRPPRHRTPEGERHRDE